MCRPSGALNSKTRLPGLTAWATLMSRLRRSPRAEPRPAEVKIDPHHASYLMGIGFRKGTNRVLSMSSMAKLAVFIALLVGTSTLTCAQEPSTKDFRVSLSVSPFTELAFRYGITFSDGKVTAKNPEDLQRMFVAHGANEVYARVATTQRYRTGFGDHSMERA